MKRAEVERKAASLKMQSIGNRDMPVHKTYYDLLQVTRDASPEVIRAAYKSLTQRYHPDRNPNDRENCERMTMLTNRAYEVLSDPAKRAEYDKWIADEEAATEAKPASQQPTGGTTSGVPAAGSSKPAPADKQQGMRLATWTIYVLAPASGVFGLLLAFMLPYSSNSIWLGVWGFWGWWVASLMSKRSRLGWQLNFASILLSFLCTTALLLVNGKSAHETTSWAISVLGVILACIYWSKRKHVFDGQKNVPFPKDWRQGWLIGPAFVVIGVLAFVGILEIGRGNYQLNPADTAASSQSQSSQATQQPSQEEIKRTMDEHAQQWYRLYPFLDNKSPQANATAIWAVIDRRNELNRNGADMVTAMDDAIRQIGPQYDTKQVPTTKAEPAPRFATQPIADADNRPSWERKICPNPYSYVKGYDQCCLYADPNNRCVKPKY